MTNHSLVAVLSGLAVVTHGLAKPSCEQVTASPESCMAGQGFSLHPRGVGGACANPDEREKFCILLDMPTFYPERLRNLEGNLEPSWALQCLP